MDRLNIIWKSYHEPEIIARGYWDQAILEDLFKKFPTTHHTEFPEESPDGAVVIINGRTHIEDTARINEDIARLRWCLLIITGDEEGLFPLQEIRHTLIRHWVQLPRMNIHNDVSYKLPNGYRPGTPQILKQLGPQEKTIDFFFAGQINHARREQCRDAVAELANTSPEIGGQFIGTDGFGKEAIDQKNYVFMLTKARVALCPSGIETPDTFRLYEALEAGCVPIVDAFATRNQSYGFWQYLFGEDPPFPIIDYWDKLPALLPELLREYPHNASKVFAWWQNKKRQLYFKLIDDIGEIAQ